MVNHQMTDHFVVVVVYLPAEVMSESGLVGHRGKITGENLRSLPLSGCNRELSRCRKPDAIQETNLKLQSPNAGLEWEKDISLIPFIPTPSRDTNPNHAKRLE